ncbi:2,3-dehydroadipyl-CoA hydratase PaaF [Photobacterium rosenbergii]|uniref:2,3-dehydroadipyl-CoA hydratase PaaF n=1 Tax=Photobacterium rosenbergii TaxID=294936 RepID=A0ABU3ZJK0_9GAMM|nr:2,3-dehydroadipyl-CoA hydratase PaaF [Photobacterium rosenbergii]MDV5170199.1 2,3-dehydroadipyl-CoA hydratase PaaF [Photobacterium rosenbergii]
MTLGMDLTYLDCSQQQGVLTVCFTHYQKRNALTNDCLEELANVLDWAEGEANIGAVVVTGGERCFAAGADLNELASQRAIDTWLNVRPRLWQRLNEFNKPLLAAVNGYALGAGLELVLLCDVVVAGEMAVFGLPEITLGLMPGAGGTQRLSRTVGKSLANQMVLTGESISASRAQQAGLVSEVVVDALTLERCQQIANKIAQRAPLAVRAAKQALQQVQNTTLEQGLKQERQLFSLLAASQDRQEGIDAFFNKRSPNYQGK